MATPELLKAEIEKFKLDAAKLSGHYLEFLVVVKSPSGQLLWKVTDPTWATGACVRYLNTADEMDREDQRSQED